MHSFIKAAEVWLPTADGSMLEFGDGLFGSALAFGAVSRQMCFGRGEGLPGRAWDEGHPVVLRQFQGSYFRRSAAAHQAGLTSAIAMPVFVQNALTAVLVFFCGDDADRVGAIELWRNDPRVSTDMTLVEGHFGAGGEALEAATRETYLPRGSGLPGMAWQRGAAVMVDDLGQSGRFLRHEAASEAGITRGLALPCPALDGTNYVLSFLGAAGTPIAQRLESWSPDASGTLLQRVFGYCESAGDLPATDGLLAIGTGPEAGAIGRAFASGVPAVTEHVRDQPGVGTDAGAARLHSLLAIPVVVDGDVAEVVALYF